MHWPRSYQKAVGRRRRKTSKKSAANRQPENTVAKRLAAKKPATKRTTAPSTKLNRVSKIQTEKAKRKLQKKTVWKISPQNHHTVYLAVFEKDGVTIDLYQAFVDAFIIVAQKPKLTKCERDMGISIDKFKYSHYKPSDDSDGPHWTFPDNFPAEEQEKIKNLLREGYHHEMIKAGWTCYDKTRFYGPLSVERVESEYPYNPV
jgi:hypothetical protein